jgi:hypothetical protein
MGVTLEQLREARKDMERKRRIYVGSMDWHDKQLYLSAKAAWERMAQIFAEEAMA